MNTSSNKISNDVHVTYSEKVGVKKIVPTGVTVKVDINPIARYSYATGIYSRSCNEIEGIQLVQICCPSFISWLYDGLIYFYVLFYMTLTCQSSNERSCLTIFLILAFYFLVLFGPYICLITLIVTGLFFLYYVAGLVIYFVNISRLGNHEFTEKMVHSSLAPSFEGQNEFFEVHEAVVQYFYSHSTNKNITLLYQKLNERKVNQFMSYQQCWLDDNYDYIRSVKMIIIHILIMVVAILGVYGSTQIFPSLY